MTDGRPARHLSESQRFNWLRLIRTERIGPVTFRHLVDRHGSAEAALAALPSLAAQGQQKFAPPPSISQIEDELAAAAQVGARFIALGEPEYPPMLRHLENAPPLIAVRGDADALARAAVAIVGSRNASTNGMKLARTLAADLAGAGFPVASGLARGIDGAAHAGALERGGTIAVLAGGLDRPYPPQNVELFERLCASPGSCAVSLMPFGHEPQARDFPRRNAIIAGLALGVVVVEASDRSGSLITATMATEAGRMVFAVPGHPLDPRSAGTNGLIREGAELIRNAADVLEVVGPMQSRPLQHAAPRRVPAAPIIVRPSQPMAPASVEAVQRPLAATPAATDPADAVWALLGAAPTLIDDVIRESGLPPAVVSAVLLDLELSGRVERKAGGVVVRLD